MIIETQETYNPIARPKRQRITPPEELQNQLEAEVVYDESSIQLNAMIPEYLNEQELKKLITARLKEGSQAFQCTNITTKETTITILGIEVTQVQNNIQTKRRYCATLKKPFILPSPICQTTNTIRFFEPSDMKTMFKLANTVPIQTDIGHITTELVTNTLFSTLRNHTHLAILFPTIENIKLVIILIFVKNQKESAKFLNHDGSPIFFKRNAKGTKFSILAAPKTDQTTTTIETFKTYFKSKEKQDQENETNNGSKKQSSKTSSTRLKIKTTTHK